MIKRIYSSFRGYRLGKKLTAVIMLASILVVLLSFFLFVATEATSHWKLEKEKLASMADIIGQNSIAAITFGDAQSAEETLAGLRNNSHILAAYIEKKDGSIFAGYLKTTDQDRHAETGTNSAYLKAGKRGVLRAGIPLLEVSRPITLDNQVIGRIVIQSDRSELMDRLASFSLVSLLILMSAFLFAFFISRKLQHVVSQPILDILDTMRAVSNKKDYSLRTTKQSEDEVGALAQGFNEMLEQIQSRDAELEKELAVRKRTEVALRESEEMYRQLTEISPNAITVADPHGAIRMVNRRALDLFGHNEDADVLGRSIFNWVVPEERQRAAETFGTLLNADYVTNKQFWFLRKDGTRFFGIANASLIRDNLGAPVAAIVVTTDMTEWQQMEEERLRFQKLEATGILAGGIAHDFNNLLQGIFGYMSLAKASLDKKEKALSMLDQAEKALCMSVNLTTQLLTFSKGGKPAKRTIHLGPVIENGVNFALSGSRCSCQLDIDKYLRHVEADEGQIGQVVQNIVLNASDAMPHGGVIKVSARNEEISRGENSLLPDGGLFTCIIISDSGTGIAGHLLPKIFDPYFTTKQKGSGLGLATSYSIIRNHDGAIGVDSLPGKGTTFYIYLPAAAAGEERYAELAAPASKRKGRILLMDDEEIIRNVAVEMIAALGHEIEIAEEGTGAIEKFREARNSGRPFDVVILDLTIKGGLGGEQTIRKLREIDPHVKAIVSSGYSDSQVVSDYRSYGFAAFLNKPYRIEALGASLDSLLT